jgi:pimeloyl-ACP methyl ester carboxylesterase
MRVSPRLRLVLITILMFAGLFFIGVYLISLFSVNAMFGRPTRSSETFVIATPVGAIVERLSLVNPDGLPIEAWWISPGKTAEGIVVLVPGLSDDVASLLPHFMFLYKANYNILAVNLRTHGGSGGDRISLAIHEPQDVIAALNWLQHRADPNDLPVTLIGHSLGGSTVIRVAATRPEVDGVISIAAFAAIDDMIDQQLINLPPLINPFFHLATDLAFLTLNGVWPAAAAPINDIANILPRPLLLIHGDADITVPVAGINRLYDASARRATRWIIEGGSHTFFFNNGDPDVVTEFRRRVLAFLEAVPNQ